MVCAAARWLFGGDVAHQSADALQHVDCGEVAAGGELAREPDVAIEQAAHGVGNWFVFIVAFDEHGVVRGDAANLRQSGPFDEPRHQAEHRRRIAARGRRFAGGEADFALCHGESRYGVDQQQDLAALVAEVFGDGGGGEGSLDARQCRFVAGGDDDHAAREAFGAQIAFDEFVDFTTSLADQTDHDDVGGRVATHHAEQHALADAGAGENAEALAAAAGEQGVDDVDAGAQRLP